MGKSIWTVMQVLFFGCFLLGIVCANLFMADQMSWVGFLNDSNLAVLQNQTKEREWFLYEILSARLIPFLFFLIFGFTKPGLVVTNLFAVWKGFSYGFLMASFISRYGAKGILVSFGMVMPQYLFYVPVYILLFRWILRFHKNLVQDRRILYMLILLSGLAVGIMLECYVNPTILCWITKIL